MKNPLQNLLFILFFLSINLWDAAAQVENGLDALKHEVRIFLAGHQVTTASPYNLFERDQALSGNIQASRDSLMLTELLTQQYVAGDWSNSLIENFYYNDSNNIQEVIIRQWDSITNDWFNFQKDVYSYGPEGYISMMTSQFWNNDLETWEDFSRITYSYQFIADSALVDELLMEVNYGGAWMNAYLYQFTYNIYNQVEQLEEDEFEPFSQQWQNLQQNWEADSGWIDNDRWTYTYNNHNNLTEELLENNLTGTWQNVTLTNSEYNADDILVSQLEQSWLARGWENSNLRTYTYDNITGPIVYQRTEYFQTPGNQLIECQLPGELASGVYLFSVQSGNSYSSGKIILNR